MFANGPLLKDYCVNEKKDCQEQSTCVARHLLNCRLSFSTNCIAIGKGVVMLPCVQNCRHENGDTATHD